MRTAAEILEGLPELIETPKQSRTQASISLTDPRPGDEFNQRGDIAALLLKNGWVHSHNSANGNQHWTRPGKDHATSATLKDGVFYVFSSNAHPFEQNKGYSYFQVYTLLEHGGDFSRAAAQLRMDGFSCGQQTPVDLSGILNNFQTQHNWPNPVPFDFERELPAFPVDSIEAPWLREMVSAVAKSTQTPTDLAGSLALAILGMCGAGKLRIAINASWSEPLNLFTVCSLPPGCRKSAVFGTMVEPIIDWERTETERLRPQIAEARANYEIEEQRLKELKVRAARETDSVKREQMIWETKGVAVSLASKTLPSLPRLFTDDVTPEQLARLLSEHAGRMAVLSPEAEIFEILAGRYSEGSNVGCFLKGHAGDALRVDRVGRPADYVDKPALTVALACQPDVIESLSSKPGFRGRGLLGRFLYALPKSPLGYREVDVTAVPEQIRSTYHKQLFKLLNMPWLTDETGQKSVQTIRLSAAARDLHTEFQKSLEPKLVEGGELGAMTDWAGKLAGAVARIAGGLHLAIVREPWKQELAPETMSNAITLGHYFTEHARAAFACMNTDINVEIAKRIVAWIERRTINHFTRRDVCRDLNLRTDDLAIPLKLLSEHDYIRPRASTKRKGVMHFDINPELKRTMS